MRVAIGQMAELTHEALLFAKQLGAAGVQLNTPILPGAGRWDERDLRWLRTRCEAYGLRLEAIENVPTPWLEQAMLGLPGRDAQIDAYQATIRALGRAGIPILGYHWMPLSVWRTSETMRGRGEALVSAYDAAVDAAHPLAWGLRRHPLFGDRAISAEEMWAHYTYFIRAVLPVAEQAGVTLALHPDDPPVPDLGGVARLFSTFAGFERALEVGASPCHKLDFCVGSWQEMDPRVTPGTIAALEHFGRRGKLAYVHFRNVRGTVPAFREAFIDEGDVDVVAVIRTLHATGFDGFIIDDHVPHLVDDTAWGHRGRAHATGYIAGLIRAVAALS